MPSLATAWTIAPDNTSVTADPAQGREVPERRAVQRRRGRSDPEEGAPIRKRGKNVYATMSFVKDWTVVDPYTIRLNFNGPAPERQITDLLQFISVIDPAGIDTVETKPAGTGAYMLGERVVGQRIASRPPTRTTGARSSRSRRTSCSRSSATMRRRPQRSNPAPSTSSTAAPRAAPCA